ncbi:MAG TPA: DEAD/DEAH box helicase [Alphaproteobacteria bacterium]|jgi:ATP-dependent RNA helicase DeaD|nr:DEAD/DEAH box helicase [Alphaproteobacteria bacterium]
MPFPTVNPSLQAALTERGYAEPTPVQTAVLEPETIERDLLVSAQTGSGKTVGFGLAMATTLLGESDRLEPAQQPIALVIAPTRELALQVHRELEWLYAHTGARIASCVGGMDMRREWRTLADGVHIVVGTPGRLKDHLERGNLKTSDLRCVVLDEADEMLDMGFREDLEAILDTTPDDRRTLLFSATLPRGIQSLAKRYQRNALRIAATAEGEQHGDIEYRAVTIAPHEMERAVVNVLRYFEAKGALVFCATREAVRRLNGNLLERGFTAVALSGELSQTERSHALQALRDGHARVCVATDVAARGIDLPDLGLVIQAEAPRDSETLLHRSGRTGRAGRKGTCVLLVPHSRRRGAERLFQNANIQAIWSPPPPAEKIRERDRERLVKEVAETGEQTEEDLLATRALLAERTPEELAAALVRMYHTRLPEPEELDTPSAPPPRAPQADDRRERPAPRQFTPRSDAPQPAREGMVVFRMNIGRNANADPRWMIPVICRRGGITKNEIGAIRIMDTETQFEIVERAAEQFAAEARKPDAKDPNIRFATLNEAITPAAESDMLTEAPARRYDNARPFRKKFQGQDSKPPYKGKSDFKAKPGEFKGKPGFKGKSDFKAKSSFAPHAETAPKPEGKGKLFLKGTSAGDRPLIKKRREKPAKS